MRTLRFAALALIVAVLADPSAAQVQQSGRGDRLFGPNFVGRSPALGTHGMASTSHPLATQVAIDILQAGGSAVDAAIAANATLGFVEANNCGIGGDLFAIVWDAASQELYGLNASGRSALDFTYDDMIERLDGQESIPPYGPLAITVPGAVDGWFELHGRFGTLPMEDVLAPAIRYAREGAPMNHVVSHSWKAAYDRLKAAEDVVGDISNLEETYLVNGRMPAYGEIFRNPDLANTYQRIAEGGREAFYEGDLADVIDAYNSRLGIPWGKDDLEANSSTWVEPLSTKYRGYDVFELPPNGQGMAVLQMLNILEGFDLASMGHNSADYLHVLLEAKKLAFADRARHYADPSFADIPFERLLSKEYAAEQREMISMTQAIERLDTPDLNHGDTIYLTTADSEGNMVSLIQSNFLEFGAGLVPDGLGFAYQGRGSQYNLDPDHPNAYEPGKRPFHTIIPGFVMRDGEPFMAFGNMGGPFQPQGHVQVLLNIIDFGMNLQEAGDAARFSHSSPMQPTGGMMVDGGAVAFETGVPADVQLELAHRGHNIAPIDYFGGYQAIMWDAEEGVYHGGADMRKDGNALGY